MTQQQLTRRTGRRDDVLWVIAGSGVLLLTAVLALADEVPRWEQGPFRLVNDAALPTLLVWPVMQLGNVLAVPMSAAVAAATRRLRLAVELVVGGMAAYLLARVVKELVGRGRPGELLDDVHLHGVGDSGRGFPSGHAAVAAALVYLALPHLGRRGRRVAVGCAVLVCVARVHVGAHLPLDVVGGAAMGIMIGAAVRLVPGRST